MTTDNPRELRWEDKTFYVEWFTDDRRFVLTDSEVATS